MQTKPIAIEIMPFEKLAEIELSLSFDGTRGTNRELTKTSLIPAKNDIQAIECWLSEYKNSEATYRNYRKEAERLLLWSIIERHKPLSSLTAEDLLFYSQFLSDPQPREKWCGAKLARKGQRWTAGWRPFVSALGQNSKIAALKNLASLFNYLTENQYLAHNPMQPVRRQLKNTYHLDDEKWRINKRIIDMDEWFVLQDVMDRMPETNEEEKWEKVRLRFLMALGYFGTLRNHELESHRMNAFRKMRDWQSGKDRWWLRIRGKGGKFREVPVNQCLFEALINYRRFLKLPDEPTLDESEPLLKSLKTEKAITSRRINQLIKKITQQAAEQFEKTHPEKAERLRKFSAHWLRHLSCSMQGIVNISKQHIKENAGHENESTTDIYLHALDSLRHEEMNKLTWRPHLVKSETSY